MFLVFSSVILNYIVSKEGKLLDPKKIATIVNMSEPKTPKDIQVFNNMAYFIIVSSRTSLTSWLCLQNCYEKLNFFNELLIINKSGRQASIDMWMH